jgi:transposase
VSSSPTCTCAPCPTHGTPGRDRRSGLPRCAVYPSSATTDAQWAIIEPLLPPPGNTGGRGGRREKHDRRLLVDAIFYLIRGGVAWRELPREFPPRSTVWDTFTRWLRSGAWARVHDALRDRLRIRLGRRPQPSAAIIDSQSVRAADTVAGGSRGYDAGKKINGRKRHLAVDTNGLLLAVIVTIAGIQDRDGGLRLLGRLREGFSTVALVWADAGYAGRLVTFAAGVPAITVQVVRRADDQIGFQLLHRRWVVERTLAWISKYRRCVRDYERRIDTSEAMVHLAMIMTMSRRLARN